MGRRPKVRAYGFDVALQTQRVQFGRRMPGADSGGDDHGNDEVVHFIVGVEPDE